MQMNRKRGVNDLLKCEILLIFIVISHMQWVSRAIYGDFIISLQTEQHERVRSQAGSSLFVRDERRRKKELFCIKLYSNKR